MINFESEGIYCSKCNDLHPTLMWHDKYDDYLMNRKERWEENKEKRPQLFGSAEYTDSLAIKGLEECTSAGSCMICSTDTHFISVKTGHYVCSDECLYKDAPELMHLFEQH